jgi:3-oxoacyl-[acyl-carrier-protein] synthase III
MKSIIQHFGKYLPLNEKESEALTSRLDREKNKTQTVYSSRRRYL